MEREVLRAQIFWCVVLGSASRSEAAMPIGGVLSCIVVVVVVVVVVVRRVLLARELLFPLA